MPSAASGEPPSPAESPRVLLIEDIAADAELIVAELRRSGLRGSYRRVETEAEVRDALRTFLPDIILSDHSLPRFNALDALRLARVECPTSPVIIVTGSLDEETAAEYIKAGAVDYVVKHRLFRLGSAVKRALALRRALEDAARAEAALLRSEQRFRKLVEYASDVVMLLDAAAHILYTTQALTPTLGYLPGDLAGQPVLDLVHPDDRTRAEGLMRTALASPGAVARGALRVRHQDGSWRDLEVVGANYLADPVVEALVLSCRDVTDRSRAEAALRVLEEQHRQAQKMEAIGRLASGVAHDFNNVLTVITTCCELVLEDLPADAAIRSELLDIRQAAVRGSKLTRQLLAFSRQQPIAPQRIDLNALVGNMTTMLHRLLGGTVEASFTATPGLATVWADPGQLEQVVMNLTVNARDAMPQGGRLSLELRNVEVGAALAAAHGVGAGAYVVLAVSDTGTGMDADTRAHLFEPFFTTKPKGKGTGLGLATVYGIVQQAGGFILVDSEAGKGSTFRVYLPAG